MINHYKKYLILALVGISIIIVTMSSILVIIDEGYVGVKYVLGQIDQTELHSGLHVRLPLVNKIKIVRTASLVVAHTGDKEDTVNAMYEAPIPVFNKTSTGTTISILTRPTLVITINSSKASELLQKYGLDYSKTHVRQCTVDGLQTTFASVDLSNQATTVDSLKAVLYGEISKCYKAQGDLINLHSVNLEYDLPAPIMTIAQDVYAARLVQDKYTAEQTNAKIKNETEFMNAMNVAKVAELQSVSAIRSVINYYISLGVSPEKAIELANITALYKLWNGVMPLSVGSSGFLFGLPTITSQQHVSSK